MQLSEYSTLVEKNKNFKKNRNFEGNRINSFEQFNYWYENIKRKRSPRGTIFRGMPEAKHKLFNSAQRIWNTYSIAEWPSLPKYFNFIQRIVDTALKHDGTIGKALDIYSAGRNPFSVLSILQHYGAPTPLIDWTYNVDVALFFATKNVAPYNLNDTDISSYFSVYSISSRQNQEIAELDSGKSLIDAFPPETETGGGRISIFSDFTWNQLNNPLKQERLTTIYNQNIIPQEGLFIFNPYHDTPLEDCFNYYRSPEVSEYADEEAELMPFVGINIHKSLAEYIRRKIAAYGITSDYIYPKLDLIAQRVKEMAINSFIQEQA